MSASVRVKVDIDKDALRRAVYGMPGTLDAVEDAAEKICDRANRMCAGFKSGIRHDPKTRQRQGGTQAKYGVKADKMRRTGPCAVPMGIVFNENYAALKDTHQNNTLLKAMG